MGAQTTTQGRDDGILGLALDVTFEVTAADVSLQEDGNCRVE